MLETSLKKRIQRLFAVFYESSLLKRHHADVLEVVIAQLSTTHLHIRMRKI